MKTAISQEDAEIERKKNVSKGVKEKKNPIRGRNRDKAWLMGRSGDV